MIYLDRQSLTKSHGHCSSTKRWERQASKFELLYSFTFHFKCMVAVIISVTRALERTFFLNNASSCRVPLSAGSFRNYVQ